MSFFEENKLFKLEFIRYAFVGGIATVADFAVLFLFREFLLKESVFSLYIATALGFTAGLFVNYILSLMFVFVSAKGTKRGRRLIDIILFTVIGLIGLLLSEAGMFVGVKLLGLYYLIVKAIVTLIVLIWNYLARKFLIFDKKQ
ncbi:MAG: GtrA family protein [Lachnospiraceae bacterium]|nr:GtrA family protein [Lachnospiraceae bacterium]